MFYTGKNNDSFINTYYFWTNTLIIAVFFNYLFFRTFVINDNSFIYLITYIIDYAVFIIFFLLLFYKFYSYIFNSQIIKALIGIAFLITGILKLYLNNINMYNLTELTFFILTLIITLSVLIPLMTSKNVNELKRGIFVFIFTTLISSNINYILISANKIIDADTTHYISFYISSYMEKISSISFITLMAVYIAICIKEIIIKNIYKSFIFISAIIVFVTLIVLKLGDNFVVIIASFYGALGVGIYLSFALYVVLIIMFLIISATSLTVSIINKNYYSEFMAFTLFILAGIDISNFALRIISVFSIMEMANMENKTYLTNNNL